MPYFFRKDKEPLISAAPVPVGKSPAYHADGPMFTPGILQRGVFFLDAYHTTPA